MPGRRELPAATPFPSFEHCATRRRGFTAPHARRMTLALRIGVMYVHYGAPEEDEAAPAHHSVCGGGAESEAGPSRGATASAVGRARTGGAGAVPAGGG